MFENLLIVGVGLMGGSLALACKQRGLAKYIVGYGNSQQNMEVALDRGLIDLHARNLAQAAAHADLVVLATSVSLYSELTRELGKSLRASAILTDLGSVKKPAIDAILPYLSGTVIPQFVPAHPIAGTEKSGAANALPDLFFGKRTIITPHAQIAQSAQEKMIKFWEKIGCQVETMEPETHDRIYACVSHVPHLSIYALLLSLGNGLNNEAGAKKFFRIGGSSPEMWRDILLLNKKEVVTAITQYSDYLKTKKSDNLQQAIVGSLVALCGVDRHRAGAGLQGIVEAEHLEQLSTKAGLDAYVKELSHLKQMIADNKSEALLQRLAEARQRYREVFEN